MTKKSPIYQDLHSLEMSDAEIWEAVKSDDREVLATLPIRLGFCHENWKFVQDICVRLSEHKDETIRGNSFYGFAYTALTLGRLEKNIVKPVLLRGLKDSNELVRSKAWAAIEDVNHHMKWKIGTSALEKKAESS